jgi:hypothetical protein
MADPVRTGTQERILPMRNSMIVAMAVAIGLTLAARATLAGC